MLPWLVTHAKVIITRCKIVHDGKTVVWIMPKDNHKRNKLESTRQLGVFAGIVPRTGEFVVLTLEDQ